MPILVAGRERLLYLLFFLSGISALLYQVIWTKKLAQIFGVTSYAVATTLSIFMFGLAAGSWYFGKRADSVRKPLKLYALLELGIALTALLSLGILEILNTAAAQIGFATASSTGFTIFRAVGAFLVLISPTFFMGGTLPVLAKECVTAADSAGRRLGQLYALNTVGGIVGSIVAGFLAVPVLGLRGTLLAGVGINTIVALLAFSSVSSRDNVSPEHPESTAQQTPQQAPEADETPSRTNIMLAAFFMAGFLGLGAEVVWTRMLLLYLNPNAQAFAAILAVYLAGLGIGSALAGRIFIRRFSHAGYGALQVLTGSSVAMCLYLFVVWARPLANGIEPIQNSLPAALQGRFVYWTVCSLSLAALLLFIPTLLMGTAFPFAARFFSSRSDVLGRRLGVALTFNTMGAMLGPLLCGFWLLPALGTQVVLLFFCVGYIITGAVAAAAFSRAPRLWLGSGGVLAVGLIVVCYSSPELIVTRAYESPTGRILHHEEDVCGTVAIIEDQMPLEKYRQLVVGFTSMISDDFRCRRYTRLIGHLPVLLHPAPKKALVICMGSGMTLSAMACHPELESIDCADISPAVVNCAREYFSHVNNGVMFDPRVHVIFNDGRTHLLATRERYDIIALEPPPPNNADVANLYSREFYALCRSRLNPDGIVAQWIPYHNGTFEQMRSLIATMQSELSTTLWNFFDGLECCAIGRMDDTPVPIERIRTRLQIPAVSANLLPVGVRSVEDILACFVMGPQRILEFTDRASIVTDDRPGLGYDLSACLRTKQSIQLATVVTARYAEEPFAYFSFENEAEREAFRERYKPVKLAWLLHNRAVQISQIGLASDKMLIDLDRDFHAPLELDPDNPYYKYSNDTAYYVVTLRILASWFKNNGNTALAERYFGAAAKMDSLRPTALQSH
jgi:spermidine synthase